MTAELRCREVVALLGDHVEAALPAHRAAEVEAHLRGCGGCTALLGQLRTTIALLGVLTEPWSATGPVS